MLDISEVQAVKRTSSEQEVNDLLASGGWKLQEIKSNGNKFVYLLVRL